MTGPLRNAGAEGRRRSGDTAIFSRVLYHLSYLGMMESGLLAVAGSGPGWAKQGSNL